jgi:hypothetical protein
MILHGECYAQMKRPVVVDTISFENAKGRDLKEVVVKPKKNKYSKKNNPAVALMERVRKDKSEHDPHNLPFYNYDKYEKMVLALNEFNIAFTQSKGKIGKQFNFLANFVDTAAWTGKQILDVSLKEKASTVLSGKNRNKTIEIVKGLKSNGLDESFNEQNVRQVFDDLLKEVDLYQNDITLMQNRFVSPLSNIAADYYKYEISDTVLIGDEKCVELTFSPHNPESFSFNGKLFIPVNDSVKYVKRVSMRVPRAINLNYVDNIFISQNFIKDSLGNTHKTLDDLCLEMQFIPGTPKLYGSRQVRYSGFSDKQFPELESLAKEGAREVVLPDAETVSNEFWSDVRSIPLSNAESKMGDMTTLMRKQRFLYWSEKILKVFVNGYITTWNPSRVDIGPVNTFISHNAAEGWRFRVGGVTTPALSPHVFARGYVAYGLRDRKIKYSGELEYSFIPKKYTSREFPVNSIRATYQYDKDQLGQHYLFTNADNVFLSLKRMKSDLITYRRLAKLEYNLELRNNLSFGVELRHEIQEATRWIPFRLSDGNYDKNFTQAAFRIALRYAPGEKFVQATTSRKPINMDAPIFLLTHEYGPKGFLGADFTLNKTELSIQKRFWFSAFGYTDVILKGGMIWSKVQFPALLWQNANISYTIQPESYTLLNPMEFAMDKFASIDLSYYMNGLIFNRIPYVKKLKLREIFTFKGFMGGLSRKNNPEFEKDLYQFPIDASTAPMGKKPYMEIGAGIDNIFTILRVDYIWRLTYRDRPGIDKSGLRISLHFSF